MAYYDYDGDFDEYTSHRQTSGDREGLYTYGDDGNCDYYANGFDCRDCRLKDTCDHAKNFD